MDDSTRKVKIRITTFVNPHLFYMKENNPDAHNSLNNLENELKNLRNDSSEPFEEGDLVAAQYGKSIYRAIIEKIYDLDGKFLCFLIDHAVVVETAILFKLPSHLRKIPAFAKQACLNNVVFLHENLEFNEDCEAVVEKISTTTPSPQIRSKVLDIISQYNWLEFEISEKVSGVLIGDIIMHSSEKTDSLIKILIEKQLMLSDENLFKKIKDQVHGFKDEKLISIKQFSRDFNVGGQEVLENAKIHEYRESDISESYRSLSRKDLSDRNSSGDKSSSSDKSSSGSDSPAKINKNFSVQSKEPLETKNYAIQAKLEGLPTPNTNTWLETPSNRVHSKKMQILPAGCNISSWSKSPPKKETNSNFSTELETSDYTTDSHQTETKIRNIKNAHKFPKRFPKLPQNRSNSSVSSLSDDAEYPTNKINTNLKKKLISSPEEETSTETESENVKELKRKITNKKSEDLEENICKAAVPQESQIETSKIVVKPFCSCDACQHYTTDVSWSTCNTQDTVHLDALKPDPLFKQASATEESYKMQSVNYSCMTTIERKKTPHVLVHGLNIPTAVKEISSVALHVNILSTLQKLGYKECKRIQSYSWPAILRQHNLFIVSPSGKTMSYLPVICSLILQKDRYKQLSNFEGPIIVLLCSNSKHCEVLYDLAKKILGKNASVILSTYPIIQRKYRYCDLLITMPSVLVDLVKNDIIQLKRLCNIVIEDADVILKRDFQHMEHIFKVTETMLKHRVCAKSVQLIVVAEHWQNYFKQFIKKLTKVPLIIIGDFLEAARYGRVDLALKLLNSACKDFELKNALKDNYNIYKTVVICNSNEFEQIETTFLLKGIEGIIIKDNFTKEDILNCEEQWNTQPAGKYKVLVCSDYIFNTELTITNATLLIHYSLPNTWTRFTKRFLCFLETNKNIFDEEDKIKLKTIVFADEINLKKHMPKFLKYFTSLKIDLPESLIEWEKELYEEEEEHKIAKKIPLCSYVQIFGKPCSKRACDYRHILDKSLDVSDAIPKNGNIKFQIISIVDVTHFTVKLLEHKNLEDKVQKFMDNSEITEKLTNFLKSQGSVLEEDYAIKLCAYFNEDEDKFYRCQMVDRQDDLIAIKLLDTGLEKNTSKSKLFQLPDEFWDIPSTIVDIFAANCIPPYNDEYFSAKAYFSLCKMLDEVEIKTLILKADIYLQLGSSLWVKNIEEEKELGSDIQVYPFQLTRKLIKSKLVTVDNEQLDNLYKMCKESGISLPLYEKIVPKTVDKFHQVKPQWAFLKEDSVADVIFCAGVSPEEFYVRLNDYSKLLYSLQKDMQPLARKRQQDFVVQEGHCYLGKDLETDDYARVLVLKKQEGKVLCFFVDFGDEVILKESDLKFLPNHYIIKLPFQTIQCSLHGISNPLSEWQEDAINILYEYSLEPHTDIFRTLYVKSCGKLPATLDKQNKYSVLLKDGFGSKKSLINKILIDCGMACPTSDNLDDFEIPDSEEEQPESDDENDPVKEFCAKTEEIYRKTEMYPDDEADLEVFVDNLDSFMMELVESSKVSRDKPAQTRQDLPQIQAGPSVSYLTPDVFWSQTNHIIKLEIRITDCPDCDISIKKDRLFKFRALKAGNEYVLNLMLYEKINSFQYTILGPRVRVTLIKNMDLSWPRLLLSKEKVRNIHYDINQLDIEPEEVRKPILTLPLDPDSEADDNDDDIPMYTVLTDEDSEYGEELELSD